VGARSWHLERCVLTGPSARIPKLVPQLRRAVPWAPVTSDVRPQVQIERRQTETASLAALGAAAADLLVAGDVVSLVHRFGYARALGRDRADAVRADLASSLAEIGAKAVLSGHRDGPRVSYFKENDTGLFALVESLVATDNGKSILLELVVTSDGTSTHITLEDVSSAA
jgi:hypothetical protein